MRERDDAELSKLKRAADDALRDGELGRVSELYREMARIRYKAGENFSDPLGKAAKTRLYWFRDGTVEQVEIRAASDPCPACKSLHGRILTIDKALEEMPIPCKECTYEQEAGKPAWCRCIYREVIRGA